MNRLFFAVWPDAENVDRLRAMAEALAPRLGGQPVPRDNIHLTLAFLGDLDDERSALAAGVRVKGDAFEMSLDRLGAFRRARVAWAGCGEPPAALLTLEARLGEKLRGLGFELEERPYTPHVTLLRKTEQYLKAEPMEVIAWTVREYTLVASRARRYEILNRVSLSGFPPARE